MARHALPYLPFADFLAGLDAIGTDPPTHVHTSSWSRFPALHRQGRVLYNTFQYLGLVATNGEIRSNLRELLDTQTRIAGLAAVLRKAYPFQRPEDLRNATMERLKTVFRQQSRGKALARKALSFYLKAAHHAGFELHPPLLPRQRNQRRNDDPPNKRTASPAPESVLFGARDLNAGGTLTLRVEGQPVSQLTREELELVTTAALLFRAERKPPTTANAANRTKIKRHESALA